MSKTAKDKAAAPAPGTEAPAGGLLVAIDDGYASTKLYGQYGDGIAKAKIRSSVRPGRHGLTALSGKGTVGSYVTEEGEKFTASEDIEAESTQFDGFHTSTMNRVLINHALVAAGYGGLDVRLVTSLPVGDFYANGEKNEERIAAKRANLAKGVTNAATGKPLARLVSIEVGCQAVAAFIDWVTADDLSAREDTGGSVAVVDVGGRTTDVAVIVNGESLDNRQSGTANIGVLDVYAALNRAVCRKFDFQDQLPISVMDAAVRAGTISLWGEDQDVSDLVREVVAEQEAKIAREVSRRLGSAASLRKVLFVGGGSALFTGIANHFRNGVMLEDPEFANARGLFKYHRLAAE